jgi:hypothetical protein
MMNIECKTYQGLNHYTETKEGLDLAAEKFAELIPKQWQKPGPRRSGAHG